MKTPTTFKTMLFIACLAMAQLTQAQTMQSQPTGPSYQERQDPRLSKSGPIDADPNVYVYTAEFAKRFQMPEEWISTELKGVDAVAFRVVPSYKWCGWGGDPKACSERVSCEMDLYFDHVKNPLPWDERFPEIWTSGYKYSSRFIPSPPRALRLPKRSTDHFLARYSPFVDPKTGKGLWWQGQLMSLAGYDREIFSGVSLLTMSVAGCKGVDMIYLTSENDPYQETKAYMQARFPQAWQLRVKQATQESDDKQKAFFKQEIEKATKALRELPVPSKTIVPVQ